MCDFGDVHMLQTAAGQDAAAQVSVHFAPTGRYPGDEEAGQPGGYALLMFNTTGTDREAVRARHKALVAGVGWWLAEQGRRWCSQFEDEPWTGGLAVVDTAGTDLPGPDVDEDGDG